MIVLIRPSPGLLLVVFAWKVGTEWLRPFAGEVVAHSGERAMSYGAPIAMTVLITWSARQ